MNRIEHLLTRVMEECAEVAQRASKAQIFGMGQVQEAPDDRPDQNPERWDNRERLILEFNDLCAVMGMLDCLDIRPALITAKQAKVERYLERSREYGTLQDDVNGSRLKEQALAISQTLREAGCPSMPLDSGVAWLVQERDRLRD